MALEHGARASSPTLTFLFTDIERHSELWDAFPEAMSDALQDHDDLVTAAVADAEGRVVKNEGDGVMAVFADASRAVEAAVAIQRALATREWPQIGALRVRMGMNAGVADARGGDYFGPEVIRAARLCAGANGGQVVATRAVVELARGVDWLDLGRHRLRGFAAPVEVHQVVADGIGARFPALRTLDAHPNTLPRFRTEFFGRDDDIAAIAELLAIHRLVTLTGVGGCGKTRLAVEVAHDQLGSFVDGVYFADLSLVTEPDRLWTEIGRGLELDVGGAPGGVEPPGRRIARFLATRRALLVVDNCEHLLDAAADAVDDLLDATDDLRVLATSREGLHVVGEHLVQVPSLPATTDALRLFSARATASGAERIDNDVALRICERLDGLPLALELAAARSGQLGAGEVERRLSDRFELLTGSRRTIPRQRTLEATLDWSHDLLDTEEQVALRRLAVFSGSFSLRAAERVAGASASTVGALVEKSLVQRVDDGRFRLLETVRAYTENRLLAAGEAEAAREAHVGWLLGEVDSFSDQEVILATSARSDEFVGAELGNLYAALAWGASREDWSTVARLASYVGLAEGLIGQEAFRPVVEFLLECLDHGIEGDLRDRALAALTAVAYLAPSSMREHLWIEAGERLAVRHDGVSAVGLTYVANMHDALSRAAGDERGVRQARRMIDRATDIARDVGPEWEVIPALFDVAICLSGSEWEEAADRAAALAERRRHGGVGGFSTWTTWIEAAALFAIGRPLSRDELQRRLDGVRRRDPGVAVELHLAALAAPDPSQPRRPIRFERGDLDRSTRPDAAAVLISTAVLATREQDWRLAARMLAAARGHAAVFSSAAGVAVYRLTTPLVREALEKPERDALIAEARARGLSAALDEAVEWLAMSD